MASGPIVGENDGAREKQRFTETTKVYTRKAFKGPKKQNNNISTATTITAINNSTTVAAATTATTAATVATNNDNNNKGNNDDRNSTKDNTISSNDDKIRNSEDTIRNDDKVSNNNEDNHENNTTTTSNQEPPTEKPSTKTLPLEDTNTTQAQQPSLPLEGTSTAQAQQPSLPLEGTSTTQAQQPPLPLEGTSTTQAQQPSLPLEATNTTQAQQPSLPLEGTNTAQAQQPSLPLEDTNTAQAQQPPVSRVDAVSDDSSSLNRQQTEAPTTRDPPRGNGTVKSGSENRIKINLTSTSKQEVRNIRRKLESELDTVRSLVKRIEEKRGQISGGFSNSRVPVSDGVDNGMMRFHSEVASMGAPVPLPLPLPAPVPVPVPRPVFNRQSRPLNQLSISVLENSQGASEHVEKEKRTPKANQFYRNSEFLLAKDKFPPAESNKKSKSSTKKQGGGDLGHGFGTGSKFFRSCSALLEKLMKHKHGWVFNTPVDAKGLGLHDYFTIITHPMDLGTVKARLNKNWYKSPKEFAEDVRLTFNNAMIYNPKGQDVHVMAELLLKLFEERWAVIESEYNREMRYIADYEMHYHTPMSRKAPPLPPPPLDMRRILDRSESMTHSFDPKPKSVSTTPSSRTPAPKKPKAKDQNKRDMTYEEKQKLSTNLQGLPSEKLDNIVQIIKKRNSTLCQHDDEIEVDIDSVDAETLWELDRFVTNYKKSLSKNKRKAELAIQARAEAQQNVQQQTPAPVVAEAPKETRTDERNVTSSSPVRVEKQGNNGDNGSRSSSSSSSSSDSGSSSSDSDSDSSSSGSEGHSPRT